MSSTVTGSSPSRRSCWTRCSPSSGAYPGGDAVRPAQRAATPAARSWTRARVAGTFAPHDAALEPWLGARRRGLRRVVTVSAAPTSVTLSGLRRGSLLNLAGAAVTTVCTFGVALATTHALDPSGAGVVSR